MAKKAATAKTAGGGAGQVEANCKGGTLRVATPPAGLPVSAKVSDEALAARTEDVARAALCRGIVIRFERGACGLRNRVLTVEVMLVALLHYVTRRLPSLQALFDRMRAGLVPGLPELSFAPQAGYERLQVLSHEYFLSLLREVTRMLDGQAGATRRWVRELAPFAEGVFALDDTTLDALARKTMALAGHAKGAAETLGGRLACITDLATGRLREVLYDPDSAANEKSHCIPVMERLPAGALLVFDLGYFCFELLDALTERCCYFVTRMRAKASFKVVAVLADRPHYRDRIVHLGAYRADRAAHPVRLVELFINGAWHGYLTNALDPRMLGAAQIWALYEQRWTIEMSFAAIKRALGLAFLRVCHTNGVLIQIWSTLTIFQVLQDMRLEIAASAGWNEDLVSWTMLVRRISWYAELGDERLSLREWLVRNHDRLLLQKRGMRKRREHELPRELLAQCTPPPALPDEVLLLSPRTPRTGDQKPINARYALVPGALT